MIDATAPLPTTQPADSTETSNNSRTLRVLLWVCMLAWVVIAVWLLLTSQVPSTRLTPGSQLAHPTLFFWITISVLALILHHRRQVIGIGIGLILLSAATSEIAQTQLTNTRTGSVLDFALDLCGVIAGSAVIAVLSKVLQDNKRVARVGAFASTLALAVLASLLVTSLPAVDHWLNCRTERAAEDGRPLVSFSDGELVRDDETSIDEGGKSLFDSKRLACRVSETNELTVVVEFTSTDQTQDGPTRLLTSSEGIGERDVNFHLGQAGDRLSIRLRIGNEPGRRWDLIPGIIIAGQRQSIAITFADSSLLIYADGQLVTSYQVNKSGLGGWDETYPLLIGDELGGGRTFIGTIHSFEIFARALPPEDLP